MHQSALLKTNQIEKERMAINTRHEDNFNFLFKRKLDLLTIIRSVLGILAAS